MPKFSVEISHNRSTEEVRERLARAQAKLESDFGATCSWQGDSVLLVKRKGLDGRVAIEADKLRVDVDLGFLLSPMAGTLKEGIAKRLTALLA